METHSGCYGADSDMEFGKGAILSECYEVRGEPT